ncbi:MAG: methylated-DNA--[protein]-cysteine S-methyltransferase [Chloroflexota bacterium]
MNSQDSTLDCPGHFVFETAWGWIGILGSARGLSQVVLPQTSPGDITKRLPPGSLPCPHLFAGLPERLRDFFRGKSVDFSDVKLDTRQASPFARRVWEAARLIPYSRTRTYAWVAERTGQPRAARAVGQALGRNPLPIVVPCHRVVAGHGIGGFSSGLELKRRLLALERKGPECEIQ